MKNVLLIGDSTRQGYDKYVRAALEDCAQVYYPEENCRFTPYILRYLWTWLEASGFGEETDCVHWNAGLWDCMVIHDGPVTPLEVYAANIERICQQIRRFCPKAKVIFATSTPILEEQFAFGPGFKQYNKDIEAFNAAAVEVVKKYGFAVNDLYALMKDTPASYHSDAVHFYTPEATKMITSQVLRHIQETIGVQPKAIDSIVDLPEKDEAFGL